MFIITLIIVWCNLVLEQEVQASSLTIVLGKYLLVSSSMGNLCIHVNSLLWETVVNLFTWGWYSQLEVLTVKEKQLQSQVLHDAHLEVAPKQLSVISSLCFIFIRVIIAVLANIPCQWHICVSSRQIGTTLKVINITKQQSLSSSEPGCRLIFFDSFFRMSLLRDRKCSNLIWI